MIDRPPCLTGRPGFCPIRRGAHWRATTIGADALSHVLKTVRLTGAVFFDVVARAPWAAEQPSKEMVLPLVPPGAEHLVAYHVVTEGRCFAGAIGGEPIPVEAGEVVVFAHGDPHVLSSAPGLRAGPLMPLEREAIATSRLPFTIVHGADGPAAKLVCGFLACDARPFNPLLDTLPRIIKAGDGETGWLGEFIRFAMRESAERRAGGESVLAKLSELMFIEVIRRHIESLPPEQAGWLAGLRDPFVGKALSLLHGAPARNWTIEELAREVGQSRSVLAERFTHFVGIPPLQYLARWRMQLASTMLGDARTSVATIAEEIGYASEAAFSRAFRKVVGLPPSAWRRKQQERRASA